MSPYSFIKKDDKYSLDDFNEKISDESILEEASKIYKEKNKAQKEIKREDFYTYLKKIKGQDDNVEYIFKELRSWYGKEEHEKPLSFFLVGESGVGKSYTAELVAEFLRNKSGYSYIIRNMNQFQDDASKSNLVGSPAGYAGNEAEPKLLTEIKKKEKIVFLFDEIEKAHKNIMPLFMQFLEKGELEFNVSGNTIVKNFNNCVIFFTSNARMNEVVKEKKNLIKNGITTNDPKFQEKIAQVLIKGKTIPNELERRIDGFLVYMSFNLAELPDLIYKQLDKLIEKEGNLKLIFVEPEFLADIALKSRDGGIKQVNGQLKKYDDVLKEFADRINWDEKSNIRKIMLVKKDDKYVFEEASEDKSSDRSIQIEEAKKIVKRKKNILEFLNITGLQENLSAVKGQDDNIKEIITQLDNWYPLKPKGKPLVFMFLGPSGTGKTFTAEQIYNSVEQYGYGYYKINCSEITSSVDVMRIVGSPAGGDNSKPPVLFEDLERSDGKLVIVFDEIEKAYPGLITRMMQLLEKGELSWSGGSGDFRKCIIIFTSNYEMEYYTRLKDKILKKGEDVFSLDNQSKIFEKLLKFVRRPELERRFDAFFIFNRLSAEDVLPLIVQEIVEKAEQYSLNDLFYISSDVLAEIAEKALDPKQNQGIGAIEKVIERLGIENAINAFRNKNNDGIEYNIRIVKDGSNLVVNKCAEDERNEIEACISEAQKIVNKSISDLKAQREWNPFKGLDGDYLK